MTEVSVVEAKARLADLIRRAEAGESVHITRRGKAVAVLVSESELAALRSRAPTRDLWETIADWRAGAGFDWPDLTDTAVDGWRDRSPGRTFEWPE